MGAPTRTQRLKGGFDMSGMRRVRLISLARQHDVGVSQKKLADVPVFFLNLGIASAFSSN
jgi:hypothetical protein